jgi:hypothetical protein
VDGVFGTNGVRAEKKKGRIGRIYFIRYFIGTRAGLRNSKPKGVRYTAGADPRPSRTRGVPPSRQARNHPASRPKASACARSIRIR